MPVCTLLIGAPGSGKSTWRANQILEGHSFVVVSTDDVIDEEAAALGLTYSEAFHKLDMKVVERQAFQMFEEAVVQNADIVVDRTNMNRKSRRRIMEKVPSYYEFHAVVFEIDDVLLQERLAHRAATTGKHIPPNVVESMRRSYEEPSADEGFAQITVLRA